jgi:CelD/BcsL family acetyltransferase involved in cellulose biosynthesis/peptidoglycan/xylan/chitin deacetylase (PgdA/CDA1 family)
VKVEVHQEWEDVRALSPRWNELLCASAADTVFLTWEWTNAWWASYAQGRQPFVLSAWDNGELVGLAPFYLDCLRRWGRSWKYLRLIGDGSNDSDYLDCFALRGLERETTRAFAGFLAECQDRWNWLDLHGPRTESPTIAGWVERAREQGWEWALEKIPCATLKLPQHWDEFLQQLKPRFRTKVRSCLSFFEGNLGSTPLECASSSELDGWLEQLFDLHTRRWLEKAQPGVFGNPAKRDFYRRISKAMLERGWLAFHRLSWGDRPLALQYGFRYHNRFWLLQEGYDPGFENLRPGLALRGWLMRNWIANGCEEYDFLAGDSPYKLEWGAQVHWCVRLRVASAPSAAWAAFRQDQLAGRLKQRVRPLVPEPVLSLCRRWQARGAEGGPEGRSEQAKVKAPASAGLARRLASRLYLRSFLGTLGRALANRFELVPARRGPVRIAPRCREAPVLHILMFHRVNDDSDPFFHALPSRLFRAQMEYIARNFRVVSLDDLWRANHPENGCKYSVALTFDDGYRDNYLHAFPILRELGLPATIFLATGYIESGESPWHDQVRLAFKLTTQTRLSLAGVAGAECGLDDQAQRLQALQRTLAWLRGLDEPSRSEALRALFGALRVSGPLSLPNVMLNWDEIRRMAKCDISFGAHTITHPVLAKLPSERLTEEITGSKKTIEERLQAPVRHFAYPFGREFDIGDQARNAVQQAGFATAVTTIWGFNRPGDDPYMLKRFTPRERDPGVFAIKLDWFRLSGFSGPERRGASSGEEGANA